MKIIIDTYSMIPIYEQIIASIKHMILSGELKISALTVKKAYDALEEEGLTATIHGKGTYVCAPNRSMIQEEQRRELEKDLEAVAQKAKRYGVSREELANMLEIITEE